MILTEEEWMLWKDSQTTREFFRMLKVERERVKELLILGLYEKDEQARGIARCLEQLQEMDFMDFREVMYGEPKRNHSEGT